MWHYACAPLCGKAPCHLLLLTPVCHPCCADLLHPYGLGQKLMCDLAGPCCKTLPWTELLLQQPWDQQDEAMLKEPLPEPMYQGGGLLGGGGGGGEGGRDARQLPASSSM
jgi:hypothetical protein